MRKDKSNFIKIGDSPTNNSDGTVLGIEYYYSDNRHLKIRECGENYANENIEIRQAHL